MFSGLGRKTHEPGRRLTLGVKQTACCCGGIAGLLLLTFVVGVLAGRGDIYRVLAHWGFVDPQSLKVAQPWLPPEESGAKPPEPTAKATPAAAPASRPGPSKARTTPVAGHIVSVPVGTQTAPPAKKTHRSKEHKSQQAKEDALKRQGEVRKLRFLNSQKEQQPKLKPPKHAKGKGEARSSTAGLKKVAAYKDNRQAQAKAAELKKKGKQATVKAVKEAKGTLYVVYTHEAAAQKETVQTAKKKDGPPGKAGASKAGKGKAAAGKAGAGKNKGKEKGVQTAKAKTKGKDKAQAKGKGKSQKAKSKTKSD